MADVTVLQTKLGEIHTSVEKFVTKQREHDSRLLAMEQRVVAGSFGASFGDQKSLGEEIVNSENFQAVRRGARASGKIAVGSLHKAATIISPGGLDQPLVAPDAPTRDRFARIAAADRSRSLGTKPHPIQSRAIHERGKFLERGWAATG